MISFWTPVHNPEVQQWYQKKAAPAFEAKYGVKVKFRFLDFSNYVDAILVAVAAGTGPDTYLVSAETMPFWADKGLARPLDAYVKTWAQQRDIIAGAWKAGQWKGAQTGIPYTVHAKTILYRKDVFAQCGLVSSRGPDTWEELKTCALKTTRWSENKVTRLGMPVPGSQDYSVMVWSYGGEVLSADLRTAKFNSREGIEALRLRVETNDLQVPRGKELSLGGDFPNTIATGKLVMGWCAPNHVSTMLRTAPQEEQNLGVGYPPKAKERVTEIHTTKLAISTQTKRPDLAWKWVSFLMEPANLRVFCDALERFPARKSLADSRFIINSRLMPRFMDIMNDFGRPWIETPTDFVRLQAIMDEGLLKAINHKKSPEEALSELAATFDRELQRGRSGRK